jgi:hypothetical protein
MFKGLRIKPPFFEIGRRLIFDGEEDAGVAKYRQNGAKI